MTLAQDKVWSIIIPIFGSNIELLAAMIQCTVCIIPREHTLTCSDMLGKIYRMLQGVGGANVYTVCLGILHQYPTFGPVLIVCYC